MEPLDFRLNPPRGPREKLLGLVFLPRTIDKMRAQLPGGDLNGYIVDYTRGVSVYMLKLVGVDRAELQAEVASAPDEAAVLAWFEAHADLSDVEKVNAKLEALTLERLSDEDKQMVRRVHPGIVDHPELTAFFDIFEYDDRLVAHGS